MLINRRQRFEAHDFGLRRIEFAQAVFGIDNRDEAFLNIDEGSVSQFAFRRQLPLGRL